MSTQRVVVVTGTRAEYGLLRPVMEAVADAAHLELQVVVTGVHLLPPAYTEREVHERFEVAATVPMQKPDDIGPVADARALGRGISGLADAFARLEPDVVLLLGDRIEAFAAASAAAVSMIPVAHLHGGDRAQGTVDEALRHAISKIAHLHLPATTTSARRLERMGESSSRISIVGSPALDDLDRFRPLEDEGYEALGAPEVVVLLHPVGADDAVEARRTGKLLDAARAEGRVLALHPNHDPGRTGVLEAITGGSTRHLAHMPRERFIGLLRRVRILCGNSSAGLIEAAALSLAVVNVGTRQSGRERLGNVIDVPDADDAEALADAFASASNLVVGKPDPTYGDGTTGARVVTILQRTDFTGLCLRKRNTY